MYYNYFKLNYWLNTRPEPLPGIILIIIFLFGAALLFLRVQVQNKYSKLPKAGSYKSLWAKIEAFSLVNAILALSLAFFSFEMVPVLAARYWLVLWLIEMAVWATFILLYYKNTYCLKVDNSLEKPKRADQKYLPKKK